MRPKFVKTTEELAIQRLFQEYKTSARRRLIPFHLTKEQLAALIQGACTYCGTLKSNLMTSKSGRWTDTSRVYHYNGIDRLDNMLGYLATNVVTCCVVCNRAKNAMVQDDWNAWLRRVALHQLSQQHRDLLSSGDPNDA